MALLNFKLFMTDYLISERFAFRIFWGVGTFSNGESGCWIHVFIPKKN